MPRWFNTAGPCKPGYHYMLPPGRRLPQVRGLIDQMHYFVLHAPRQSGKTTILRGLADELTAEGRYAAAWVSAEQGQAFDDIGAAEAAMLGSWAGAAEVLPAELRPPPWPTAEPGDRVRSALAAWAEHCPRRLVVLVDEIDALRDEVLVSVLRQLRAGHPMRPELFPWSMALVGLRDVRDYQVSAREDGRLGTASPFNIKVESLTLSDFSPEEVAELYAQHTAETGQRFEPDAVTRAHALTQGQPWLVNALARQAVENLRPDRREPITADLIDLAARALVERQDTHLDSLSARLREDRVRAVIEPMLAGETLGDVPRDDQRFLVDLGLLRGAPDGGLEVANPIYREVLVRELATGPRASLPKLRATWLDPEGRLDPDALCEAFLAFWRQHGDAIRRSAPYHEVAAQLVLMAFLHRVVNGGGSIEREYAIGRGRMDLCLRLGEVTLAMELKAWRDGRPDPLPAGLAQLDGYLDGLGLPTGWLVIFDERPGAEPTSIRTRRELARSPAGREITVIYA
jgi:type II secretory pathway predicted ATPase ExeA